MLEISIYYDSSKTLSLNSYNRIYSLIQEIEDSVFNIFEVNGDSSISYDISKVDDTTELITSILPMLLVMLAFSSSMSLSTESIAGEKERGTLATIFVTPIKKVDVAFGKIFALSIISTISVLISTTTAVLSLSNITDSDVKINDYGWQLYILIFFVMLVTIHLFIVILLIISALSRNPKESQTSSIPLMLIVLLAGMSTMIENINVFNGASYLIPVYNSILSLRLILGNTLSIGIVITLCVNLFITILGIIFLSKLLEREKILFAS